MPVSAGTRFGILGVIFTVILNEIERLVIPWKAD